jgi:hypothetical protein
MGATAKTGRNRHSPGRRRPSRHAERSGGAPWLFFLGGTSGRVGRAMGAAARHLSRHAPRDSGPQRFEMLVRRVAAARLVGA